MVGMATTKGGKGVEDAFALLAVAGDPAKAKERLAEIAEKEAYAEQILKDAKAEGAKLRAEAQTARADMVRKAEAEAASIVAAARDEASRAVAEAKATLASAKEREKASQGMVADADAKLVDAMKREAAVEREEARVADREAVCTAREGRVLAALRAMAEAWAAV